jgi:lysozyme
MPRWFLRASIKEKMMSTIQPPPWALGIDVSHLQGSVAWNDVLGHGGRSFAFVKASEGVHMQDPLFANNWRAMAEVGVTRGLYHYFHPLSSPEEQIQNLLNTVKSAGGFQKTDLPAAVDVETDDNGSPEQLITSLKDFLTRLENETGKTPILYTYASFGESMKLGVNFSSYPLWIAHYTSAPEPTVPAGWDTWTFWQYAAGEQHEVSVPGISGGVDSDRYHGTHQELIERFQLNVLPSH